MNDHSDYYFLKYGDLVSLRAENFQDKDLYVSGEGFVTNSISLDKIE